MGIDEIWAKAFEKVRGGLAAPTVWLAMQAARPLTIDGSDFVVAVPPADKYLASSLQDAQAEAAIEEALQAASGRVLALQVVVGTSLADWEAQKPADANWGAGGAEAGGADTAAEPPPAFFRSEYSAAPAAPAPPAPTLPPAAQMMTMKSPARPAAPARALSPTWEKLNERLSQGYKTAPLVKYPHGQAQYVLTAVKLISDTMDALMPPGAARDDHQERLLAKAIERLGSVVNLDPMFLSLELLRFRESEGKGADIPL